MDYQISKIPEFMEDIKCNISDHQYEIIMDNLMNLHNKTKTQDDNIRNDIDLLQKIIRNV
jgi:hypothetical protein